MKKRPINKRSIYETSEKNKFHRVWLKSGIDPYHKEDNKPSNPNFTYFNEEWNESN